MTAFWIMVAAGLAAALVLSWVHILRRARSVQGVEAALVAGRPKRAQRIARRLWRRDPAAAPESVFLYAVSLYVQGKDARLLADLGPMVGELPESEKPWVAFLLFKAAARMRDPEASRRWRRVARRASELRPYLDSEERTDPPRGRADVGYA
jgi:hypothetical protein